MVRPNLPHNLLCSLLTDSHTRLRQEIYTSHVVAVKTWNISFQNSGRSATLKWPEPPQQAPESCRAPQGCSPFGFLLVLPLFQEDLQLLHYAVNAQSLCWVIIYQRLYKLQPSAVLSFQKAVPATCPSGLLHDMHTPFSTRSYTPCMIRLY